MPPFFDRVQLHDALQNEAMPALEALAANNELHDRSLRRFERDEPPPYESSTESDEFDDESLAPQQPLRGELPDELTAVMEPPITDDEIRDIVSLDPILRLEDLYRAEAKREERRVSEHRLNPIFGGAEGTQRLGVFVRHNVRRRWERLGIWNPEWGFPGRNVHPQDNPDAWRWRWEEEYDDDTGQVRRLHMEEVVARALRLRQNLRRGESVPAVPRSSLGDDASASLAESFLISRPWFAFQLEIVEEKTRYHRLSTDDQRRYAYSARNQVIQWWKERGDWREEFDERNWVTSWKWRHESPSPEPQDLTPLANRGVEPLRLADMELTPSEYDDMRTADLPASEQPESFWKKMPEEGLGGTWPGQVLAPARPPPPRPDSPPVAERAPGFWFRWGGKPPKTDDGGVIPLFGEPQPPEIEREPPPKPDYDTARYPPGEYIVPNMEFVMASSYHPVRKPNSAIQSLFEGHHDEGPPEDDQGSPPPEEQQGSPSPPPQEPPSRPQRQRRSRKRGAGDGEQPSMPPRRSSRIAGIKRQAEAPPAKEAPSKRPRGRPPKAVAATPQPKTQRTRGRAVPARPPPKTQAKKGPGRPRKADAPSAGSGVTKKKDPGRPARSQGGKGEAAPATDTPRRRGRPRKDAVPAAPASAQTTKAKSPSGAARARAAAQPEADATPKRGRGRPRKDDGPGSVSGGTKKSAAARTPARRGVSTADSPAGPRRRGRPRKDEGTGSAAAAEPVGTPAGTRARRGGATGSAPAPQPRRRGRPRKAP